MEFVPEMTSALAHISTCRVAAAWSAFAWLVAFQSFLSTLEKMATVAPPAKILVTGANGFIAVWIIRILLEQGYSVRGTVRSKDKGDHLEKLFDSYGAKLEYFIVPDVTKEGAFDDAVKDVDAVLHTAAPVVMSGTYETVVKPALDGTLSILKSALHNGQKVRRIVLTSSFVAVMEPRDKSIGYTEADWNNHAVNEVQGKGDNAPGYLLYFAAKTLAERAAWDFVAKHKSEVDWDLVTVLPSYVFGPSFHEAGAAWSQTFVYDNLLTEHTEEEACNDFGLWIDVRDAALAHVLALQKPDAGGERFILAASSFCWQDIVDAVADMGLDIPKTYQGAKRVRMPVHNEKATEILGLSQFQSLAESVRETVASVEDHLSKA